MAGAVGVAATVGVLLNVYRRALYAFGIPFTLGQIVVWAMQGMPDVQTAMIDKPVQILLVVLLGYLLWTERR